MNMWDMPPPGLYRIYWNTGGFSLAAVGMTSDGGRWIAPTNWISPAAIDGKGWTDWRSILRWERIDIPAQVSAPAAWGDHLRAAQAAIGTVLVALEQDDG